MAFRGGDWVTVRLPKTGKWAARTVVGLFDNYTEDKRYAFVWVGRASYRLPSRNIRPVFQEIDR